MARATGGRCGGESAWQGDRPRSNPGPRLLRGARSATDAHSDGRLNMPQPVFLVVAENGNVRDGLSADLRRRFAAAYHVVGVASPTTALTMLAELAHASQDVTL